MRLRTRKFSLLSLRLYKSLSGSINCSRSRVSLLYLIKVSVHWTMPRWYHLRPSSSATCWSVEILSRREGPLTLYLLRCGELFSNVSFYPLIVVHVHVRQSSAPEALLARIQCPLQNPFHRSGVESIFLLLSQSCELLARHVDCQERVESTLMASFSNRTDR